jgi:hypothetical protein
MAVPHGLVQKDEEAAIAAARQGISNGSRSINDLPGSVSFSAALSLQAKMCRQRLRRRVETALSSCPPEIQAFSTEPAARIYAVVPKSVGPPLRITIESSAFRYRRRRKFLSGQTPRQTCSKDSKWHSRNALLPSKYTGRDGVDGSENY